MWCGRGGEYPQEPYGHKEAKAKRDKANKKMKYSSLLSFLKPRLEPVFATVHAEPLQQIAAIEELEPTASASQLGSCLDLRMDGSIFDGNI